MREQLNVKAGMPEMEARQNARRRFGNATQLRATAPPTHPSPLAPRLRSRHAQDGAFRDASGIDPANDPESGPCFQKVTQPFHFPYFTKRQLRGSTRRAPFLSTLSRSRRYFAGTRSN